jgi:predicted ATPase/DNA-binding CsgD family transcriptional regulator
LRKSPLTKREQEVLELMAFGLSNKEIARRLGLGRRTVETHIDHVLGKLEAPTRTKAVVEAGRAGLLGPIAAADTVDTPHNIPFQLTTLIGREQDLADAKALLDGTRLLTLSGSGGVGKTRLALGLGIDLLDSYTNGVWFCDFAPISDPELVTSLVTKVLGVPETTNRSLAEAIASSLRRKHALLIFDNCEHVLDAAAELGDEILHRCPDVRILATSRQPLGIIGEVVQRVRSLAWPNVTMDLKAEEAVRFGAVALFADRAQAADTSFAITDDNAPVVAEICRRLDGIPLAIELTATRLNAVSLESLAHSLDDRFRALTAGSRTAMPRHKTLAALIDWSYDLLSPAEQLLFDRLGIFAGSFSMAAAIAICSGDGLADAEIVDLTIALVDKSLVVVQTGLKEDRYRLLEATRAYALEKLRSTGERELFARRHAAYFRDRAKTADECFGIGSTVAWAASLEPDLENFRAALEWALTGGHDVALGGSVAGGLERLWALAGLAVEARWWLAAALERLDEARYPAIAARVWRARARFVQGQPMRDCLSRALALYESVGDGLGAATVMRTLAFSLLQMGRLDEANDIIDRAITALREHGDRVGVASCLLLQGLSAYNHGDFARGRQFYYQALAAYKSLGDESATANVLGNLAELEFADGHPDRALESVSESLAITSRGKDAIDLGIDYNNSGAYQIALGRLDEARASIRASLRCAHPERNPWNTGVALQHTALLAALAGDVRNAAQLLGYVNAQFKKFELERETTEKWGYAKLMETLQELLGPDEIQRLGDRGAAWTEDEAVAEALKI